MNQEEIIKRLHDPFGFKDVEWKIQVTTQDKTRGMAVAYLNSRAIQTRLDEVVGASNWKNTYSPWRDNAQICGLSVYDRERNDWVTKYDGAENTDIEPVKGGLSDSFKRAACMWGIGRYLYELGGIWVEIEQRGKGSVIKDDQYGKLETEYNKAVAKIFFNAPPNQEKTQAAPAGQKPPLVSPAHDNAQPAVKAPSTAGAVPKPGPQTVEPQKLSLKEEGERVISEIGKVISAASPKGGDYFTEDEKEEARELIRSSKVNEKCIADLKDFQTFLSEELAKRESKIAA
jgi:hypothetical protein